MKPKQENTCKLCEIQQVLDRCWTDVLSLPSIGTSEQYSACSLAMSALSLAEDLYNHNCEFSGAPLQEAADVS